VILPYLVLGNGRYLDMDGKVVERRYSPDEIEAYRRIVPDFDPDVEACPSDPERLTAANRSYWTEVAAAGGHDLNRLLEP
jgi:hypothetical protein